MTDQARKELEEKAHNYTWETLLLNENDPTFKAVADAYIAGAEGYEKQKEINKELVDDIAALNKRIRELEKDKAYFSDNLDAEVEKKLEMQKEINELRKRVTEQDAEIERLAIEKRLAAEQEARDIRARFPC